MDESKPDRRALLALILFCLGGAYILIVMAYLFYLFFTCANCP